MNQFIIFGILVMVLGNDIGLYLINIGRTELATKNSNKTREKIEEKASESKDRDEKFQKTLEDGIADMLSTVELKEYYIDRITKNSSNAQANSIAIESIEKILAQLPGITSNNPSYRDKALMLFGQKKIDEAIALMNSAPAKNVEKEYLKDLQLQINLHFANLDIQKAISLIDKVVAVENNIDTYLSHASAMVKFNLLNKADEYFGKAEFLARQTNDTESLQCLLPLYSVVKMKLGRNEDGFQDQAEALRLKYADEVPVEDVGTLINKGMYYYNRRELVRAESVFNQAKTLLDKSYDRNNKSHVLDYCAICQNLANVHIEHSKDLELAAKLNEDCKNEISQNPEFNKDTDFIWAFVNYHYTKGLIMVSKKQHRNAIHSFDATLMAIKLFSEYKPQSLEEMKAKTLRMMGESYFELGDSKSITYLKNSLDLYKELNAVEEKRFTREIRYMSTILDYAKSRL